MSDKFDEQVAALLPCECDGFLYVEGVAQESHTVVCPSYYRRAVAEALRKAENLSQCEYWRTLSDWHKQCQEAWNWRDINATTVKQQQTEIAALKESIRQFLYEPLPGIALPEKYEHPYNLSQESWNKRIDTLAAAIKDKP